MLPSTRDLATAMVDAPQSSDPISATIARRSSTAEGRLSVISALIGHVPIRALNDGAVWTIAVYEVVRALCTVADGDLVHALSKWRSLTCDAPPDYLDRVAVALEEA